MKLAVVGSRFGFDRNRIFNVLNIIKPTSIISGGANGVDLFAALYATELRLPLVVFLPDWGKYGKRAGAIRNKQIVDYCDKLVAFWDGESKGTKISIDMAKQQNKLSGIYGR